MDSCELVIKIVGYFVVIEFLTFKWIEVIFNMNFLIKFKLYSIFKLFIWIYNSIYEYNYNKWLDIRDSKKMHNIRFIYNNNNRNKYLLIITIITLIAFVCLVFFFFWKDTNCICLYVKMCTTFFNEMLHRTYVH